MELQKEFKRQTIIIKTKLKETQNQINIETNPKCIWETINIGVQ